MSMGKLGTAAAAVALAVTFAGEAGATCNAFSPCNTDEIKQRATWTPVIVDTNAHGSVVNDSTVTGLARTNAVDVRGTGRDTIIDQESVGNRVHGTLGLDFSRLTDSFASNFAADQDSVVIGAGRVRIDQDSWGSNVFAGTGADFTRIEDGSLSNTALGNSAYVDGSGPARIFQNFNADPAAVLNVRGSNISGSSIRNEGGANIATIRTDVSPR